MVNTTDLYAIREALYAARIFVDTARFMRNTTLKYLENDALISLVETVCGDENRFDDVLAQLTEASSLLDREIFYRAEEEEYNLASIEDCPF